MSVPGLGTHASRRGDKVAATVRKHPACVALPDALQHSTVSISWRETTKKGGDVVKYSLLRLLRLSVFFSVIGLCCAASDGAYGESLRYAYQTDVSTLDPHAMNETFTLSFLGNVYEGLVRWNDEQVLEPALAVRWAMEEPTRWRFVLRQGVRFHNGNMFTADDVVFSFQRARDPLAGVRNKLAGIVDVVAVDDYTVDIVTAVPNAVLVAEFPTWYIMDREWAESQGATSVTDLAEPGGGSFAALNTNGTGPFLVVEREPGVRTVARPFGGWWDAAEHNLHEVAFEPIPVDSTRVAALRTGERDLVYPMPVQDIDWVNDGTVTRVLTRPGLRTIFLGMDQSRPRLAHSDVADRNPFQDQRVRLAIYQAIDIQAINRFIMGGLARPTAAMVAPEIEGYPGGLVRYRYDPEASRRLLAEAGYPDGFSVRLDCPNDRYLNDEDICAAIDNMLGQVGIDIVLNLQPRNLFFRSIFGSGDYDTSFYLLGWSPGSRDSYNVLYNLLGSRLPERGRGVFNSGGIADPVLDALIADIQVETDGDCRSQMIREAWQRVHDAVNYIPLHQEPVIWGVAETIDADARPDNHVYWRRITNRAR